MSLPAGSRSALFPRASDWAVALVAFAIIMLVLLASYWSTVQSLIGAWDHDGTYQYAFLIFPVSLWLAYDLRHRVRANAPQPSAWGLAAVTTLVVIWYAGHQLDINLVKHVALVALFPALVLVCWGWRAMWALAFPLAYLLVFAVPWGNGLVGPLQDITAHIAVRVLEWTGVPVLMDGRRILTPAATWMVADACSGVKFFIACSALGTLYAYLMYQRWWKRILFVVLSSLVPVIANGLRVYFTILIGDTWGVKYATGTDHMIFGWQFFGTVLVLLLLAGWYFRDPPRAREPVEAQQGKLGGARSMLWLAAIAVLIAGPVLAAGNATPETSRKLQVSAPSVPGWQGALKGAADWQPVFKGSSGQLRASYRSAGGHGVVELFHAVYVGKPRRGHQLITYGNNVYQPARWQILSNASRRIHLRDGQQLDATELRLGSDSGKRLVWFWYCVDRKCTGSPLVAKLLRARDVLLGRTPHASVWALSSPVNHGNASRVRARLRAFAGVLPHPEASQPATQRDVSGGRP